jgi:hypothetical protein
VFKKGGKLNRDEKWWLRREGIDGRKETGSNYGGSNVK